MKRQTTICISEKKKKILEQNVIYWLYTLWLYSVDAAIHVHMHIHTRCFQVQGWNIFKVGLKGSPLLLSGGDNHQQWYQKYQWNESLCYHHTVKDYTLI